MARIIGTVGVVLIALAVAVPLVARLASELMVPALVGVVLYVVVRLTHYFTET